MRPPSARLIPLLVIGLFAYACRSSEPFRTATIQLGRSLNPDHTVASHTTRFKPHDTIYVSVLTVGPGKSTITTRWTYAGRVVGEPQKRVEYSKDAATEFHIQNNGGFPAGDYEVEVLLDRTSVARRAFKVEK
jgi:hypothetical protein